VAPPSPSPSPSPKELAVGSAAEWEAWLEAHHADTAEGVWLRLSKKADPNPSLFYVEAVEIALCFGWIDGQGRRNDEVSSWQRMTPRRARSPWSRINTERAERLVAEGRMRPAGQAEIDRAKADGRWTAAYEPSSTMAVPDDFLAELEHHPEAKAFFATLNRSNTYAVAYRLQEAKRPETRAKRIRTFIEKFERGERLH
jgi:uncharacterized protein YdeI (YjbR/CyaY-like superfamily)